MSCDSGHDWQSGQPIVHPDGSQSPTLVCSRCGATQS